MLAAPMHTSADDFRRGDTNQDGKVSISDVTCLINYLLTGLWPGEEAEHTWVDLGLPSGTLWATCNVGASYPEDYGDYFAWGETEPKDTYLWSTYKWCNGSSSTLTKYCRSNGYDGFVDDKTELDPEDDAAYVNWGENWRMPSDEQMSELRNQCTWTWTTHNGVNGCLVTGPNGNTLFFPAAGFYNINGLSDTGSRGDYWTRTVNDYPYYCTSAGHLVFSSSGGVNLYAYNRCYGHSVRPVRVL